MELWIWSNGPFLASANHAFGDMPRLVLTCHAWRPTIAMLRFGMPIHGSFAMRVSKGASPMLLSDRGALMLLLT
ncbi:hypothetical protein U1Q18_026388 [Sarracenia purpurea var. burkii]